MPDTDDLVVLIDGNALVHRAFHALPELTSDQGELVNAVYGFASMLVKVCAELRPRYLDAAFDTPVKTFRHAEYEGYKATRPPGPEGLAAQFGRVYELLESLGVPITRIDGYEADDVLGTLARQAVEKGHHVVILTGDTDALQLVGPNVRVLTSRRGFSDTVMYDEQAVRERYGLEPPQIADYKALCGDTSDNIPGVPGIGAKTASKLLAQYGSIEGVIEHLDELPEKQRGLFEHYRDQLIRSKHLATIVQDVPVQLDLAEAEFRHFERERVTTLLRELSFRSLVDRFEQLFTGFDGKPPGNGQLGLFTSESARLETTQPPITFEGCEPLVSDLDTLKAFVERAQQSEMVAIAVRVDGKQPLRSDIVCIALAIGPSDVAYVPIGHRENGSLPAEAALAALRPVLEAESPAKVAHNAKFAIEALGRAGVELRGLSFDTYVAASLLEGTHRALELHDVAWAKLQLQLASPSALLGTGRNARAMADVPIQEALPHVCQDVVAVHRLEPILRRDLDQDGLEALYRDIELPLVPVLARMERNGVAIDVPYLHELSRELHTRLGELEEGIEREIGHKFNVNSTQQLSQVLFDELKLPGARRTKSGRGSTGADVLEELSGAHPVVDLILEHRQLQKLKSTYADALPVLCDPGTGRLHTTYNQAGAATGRLSSAEPNLQNIPIRTDLGRRVRRAFTAGGSDRVLLSADYSQIELRVLAHMTRDPRLVEAFEQDEDIHAATAAEVLGIDLSEVTSEHRRVAKVVNFGVLYGMSGHGLAVRTGLPHEEAMGFINRYFDGFGSVRAYQDQIIHDTEQRGYATTLVGRRRYIPEIRSPVRNVRMGAQRMAINHPIQGSAADVIKVAMIRLQRYLDEQRLGTMMILTVHDELVFDVPRDELDSATHAVCDLMEGAMDLAVPLKVDLKVGDNWDEMQPLSTR